MNSEAEFSWEEAKKLAYELVFESTNKHLTDVETQVLQGAWEGKKYNEIATESGFSSHYITKEIGNQLWKKLSHALGEQVKKTDFREALRREWEKRASSTRNHFASKGSFVLEVKIESPEGPVALGSRFYIERDSVESRCYKTILEPRALIRIKAPNQMGKTSLLDRILNYASNQGYRTVRLNLQDLDEDKFSNLDKFLRCFCGYVTLRLELEDQLDNYWNKTVVIGSSLACKTYFQEYLLHQIASPLVLALDEVDRVFQFPKISERFFAMLRSWYEEANHRDIWKKLRLVVSHSTEIYGSHDINLSPFNVGLPIELKEFTLEQVKQLVQRHQLDLKDVQIQQLTALVGGHPYLVRLALYHLAQPSELLLSKSENSRCLEQLLQDAPTDSGIYNKHLRRHLQTLKKNPELAVAFKQVVTTNELVQLDEILGHKLHSMGLIKRRGNQAKPRCELYRQYFSQRLAN
ncbi:MAG: AAA-like domain-containing protein [Iphinoe sp. HA4291-MV1]|jgi:hypothetical protein|nr:AAA-like domain-containing protein [Iphinoe sp. HA4291-MV1]